MKEEMRMGSNRTVLYPLMATVRPDIGELDKNEWPRIDSLMVERAGETIFITTLRPSLYDSIYEDRDFLWLPKWLIDVRPRPEGYDEEEDF